MLTVSRLREKTAILNLTDFDSQTDSNTYMVSWTTSKLGLWPEEDGTSTCSRAYYVNKVCVVCN